MRGEWSWGLRPGQAKHVHQAEPTKEGNTRPTSLPPRRGLWVVAGTDPAANSAGFTNVALNGTVFTNNDRTILLEKANDVALNVVASGSTDIGSLIDLNLTNGTYANVTISGTVTSTSTSDTSEAAIHVRPDATGGLSGLTLQNLAASGGSFNLYLADNTTNITFGSNVSLANGATANLYMETLAAPALNLGATTLTDTNPADSDFVVVASTTDVDATGASFNGVNGASAALPALFAVEDGILHRIDAAMYLGLPVGLVRVKAGNVYVTPDSFVAPLTTTPSIQRGVDAASVGDTVNVANGTYVGNVTINKNLALLSQSGRAATTIQGVTGGPAQGTVYLQNATSAVTIGGIGRGFTIIGFDNNNPGSENAAVYFQGPHTGTQVIGNEIVANGDDGLITEFNNAISGFVIDSNIFSGKTFVGPTAGGLGFSGTGGQTDQFTTPNTPRQLVVLGSGGGAAVGTATNITFTNNQIIGTAGGLNASGQEQGNSLVTLDVANSTITGNTFAGTTTRFGAALRVRRPGTTISGNTFDSDGMGAGTEHLFVQNNTTPLQTIVAANTFDRGAYVNGTSDLSVSLAGGASRALTGSALRILPGTYTESLDLTTAGVNKSLTLSPDAGGPVNIVGNLALDAGDGLIADVGATGSDQLTVTGTVTLAGALTLNSLSTVPEGTSLVLIGNGGTDAVVGTFAGFPEGSVVTASNGQEFTISYAGGTDGNDVVLTPVPSEAATVTDPDPEPTPSAPVPVFLTAVGADADVNGSGHVKVYNQDGSLKLSFIAFSNFKGGVRVATGDVNGDGTDDIVVGAGPGAPGGHVKVFDGATGAEIRSFFAFPGFVGGVNVAVGDIDGDGVNDIVVGAGAGAPGGHVKAFSGANGTEIRSFFSFAVGYTGGVTVAAGDFDGVGGDDIVVGAATGASHVKVFSGATGAELASFFAFDAGFTEGVNVAAGNLDGDNLAELVVGSAGASAQVSVFAGGTAAARGTTAVGDFNAARVATGFFNSDDVLDILVGSGPGAPARVRGLDSTTLAPLGDDVFPFDAFMGGVLLG